MSCIESDIGLEAGRAFRRLLEESVDCSNWRVHFDSDYSILQQKLIEGEWDRVGTRRETNDDSLNVHDLCHLAEIWGEFLVPLPLIPAIAIHRWYPEIGETGERALPTFAIPAQHGGSVVPYFGNQTPVAINEGLSDLGCFGDARIDHVDPVMLVGYVHASSAASRESVQDLYALLAAEAIGCAATTLRRAIAHAGDRKAFGRMIVEFQAIRHRLADMYKDLEIARGSLVRSIMDPGDAQVAACFVFDRCRAVVEGAIQVHGGLGFTWDAGLHFYLRHVMALSDVVTVTLPGGGTAFVPNDGQ